MGMGMADLIKHTLGRGREPGASRASEGLQPRQSRSLGTTTSSWLRFYKCWCAIQRILTIQGLQLGNCLHTLRQTLRFPFKVPSETSFSFPRCRCSTFILSLGYFHSIRSTPLASLGVEEIALTSDSAVR